MTLLSRRTILEVIRYPAWIDWSQAKAIACFCRRTRLDRKEALIPHPYQIDVIDSQKRKVVILEPMRYASLLFCTSSCKAFAMS